MGIPLWNDIASVFDPETGKELDIGEKGEICYQTSSAFLEYDRNPVQTSDIKVMHSDGKVWIHTKDLGYQDEDGFLYIEGRMTRVITVGGFKISANSIEDALDDCEYIKECVAVAAPDKEFAEVPMLFVVLADGISETEVDSKLKCLCEERIKGRAFFVNKCGEHIYCFDVEDEILKLEQVYQCEVIGVHAEDGYDAPVAFVVLKDGVEDSTECKKTIEEYCAENIDENSRPETVHILDQFPVKGYGKRDMEKLMEMAKEILLME